MMIEQSGYCRMVADLLMMDAVVPSDKKDREAVMTHTCFTFNYPYRVYSDKWQRVLLSLQELLGDTKYAVVLDHESDVAWAKSVGMVALWRPSFTRRLVDQDSNHIEQYDKILQISFTPMGESIRWLIGGVMMRPFMKERKYIELKLDLTPVRSSNE